MKNLFLSLLFFCVLMLSPASYAQQSENHVKIRLLAEHASVKGGEEIWIGTEQMIDPHWHTYWKNPGDSGTATQIKWDMPDDFLISDIQWPTPQKIQYGPLLNYGYEQQVILLQKLTLPKDLPRGKITLTADVEVLVCKEECIPEYGTYTLILNGENAANEENSAYLEAARQLLPIHNDWPLFFDVDEQNFSLKITIPAHLRSHIQLDSVKYFPADWGTLANAEKPTATMNGEQLILTQMRGQRPIEKLESLTGVLQFAANTSDSQSESTYNINIKATPSWMESPAGAVISEVMQVMEYPEQGELNFFKALILAILGGMILNLMPCVFPVLSIKALSLVKIAAKSPKLAKAHGLSYTAGVIASFVLIAAILITLRAGGAQLGWGFQLQNPIIITLLGYLLFVIGLNLMGFFEFSSRFNNVGGGLAQKDGLTGSFFTGVLATLVAAPCTAPLMAGAIGFALIQSPFIALVIFSALGLGLALPYLALSFMPNLQARMPKPGAWMSVFKQILAFPMFIAALWMFWILAQQVDVTSASAALLGAILITIALWLLKFSNLKSSKKFILRILAITLIVISTAFIPLTFPSKPSLHDKYMVIKGFGDTFSQSALDKALEGDDPIFTEMTAAWCITCKVNHKIAINIDSTKALFAEHNVRYLIGDWTNEDPEITKYLQKHGRNGVPLYVFYGSRDDVTKQRPAPKLLPQVLTPTIIKKIVEDKP